MVAIGLGCVFAPWVPYEPLQAKQERWPFFGPGLMPRWPRLTDTEREHHPAVRLTLPSAMSAGTPCLPDSPSSCRT